MSQGRVLIVAGSDSGGGAGIQADLKTVTALGGFGMTAITALTAQNTVGVHGIHAVPTDFIAQQIAVTAEDLGVDAVKTGMLHSVPVIETVAEALDRHCMGVQAVIDPVMVAKGGHPLLEADAQSALIALMLPRAAVLTPNIPEAEALTGLVITSVAEMEAAGQALIEKGPTAVLIKGGHGNGADLTDVLVLRDRDKAIHLTGPRIDTPHTHGTGCTMASAIATGLAQGTGVEEAVQRARAYVFKAIAHAPGLGQGHGPLDHGHTVMAFID